MRSWPGLSCLVVILLLSTAEGADAEVPPEDPRLAEASALLSDDSQWDRALELFAEVLSESPQEPLALTWSARVRAWQRDYDASLEYYALLAGLDSPPPFAAVERAEVLSWAGRYSEAEAAFALLLAEDENNARAARGLARTLRWSGRKRRADAAYKRALALEEDSEAQEELLALRAELGLEFASGSSFESDSDNQDTARSNLRVVWRHDYDTAPYARVQWTRVSIDRSGAAPAGLAAEKSQTSILASVGVTRVLREGLTAHLELGGYAWSDADSGFAGNAGVDWSLPNEGVLAFELAHGDFLDHSASIDAVTAGLHDTSLHLSTWNPLPARFAVYGSLTSSFVSDGNQRIELGTSLDHQPFAERDVTLSLALGHLSYLGESDLYYDPDLDTSLQLVLSAKHEVLSGRELWLRSSGGFGWAHQDGRSGRGGSFGVEGGARWRYASGFWIGIAGQISRSQRSTSYETHGGRLEIGREL